MRTLLSIRALLLMGLLLGTMAFPAAAQQAAQPIVKAASVDLNGDGRADRITFKATNEEGAFALTVNNATVRASLGGDGQTTGGFRVVDIEAEDRAKEIAVVHFGANDYNECAYYRYDGKSLRRIGTTPFHPKTVGGGFVYGDYWTGFWTRIEKYALNRKTGLLALVPQEFYFVDKKATVTKSFPVYSSRTSRQTLANVALNSKIVVVLHAPPASTGGTRRPQARQWYLIRTERGLLGWVYFSDLQDKTTGLPFAG